MLLSVLLRQKQVLNYTKNQEIKGHLNSWSNTEVRKLDQNVLEDQNVQAEIRSFTSEASLKKHASEASLQKLCFRSVTSGARFRSFTSEALLQELHLRSTLQKLHFKSFASEAPLQANASLQKHYFRSTL